MDTLCCIQYKDLCSHYTGCCKGCKATMSCTINIEWHTCMWRTHLDELSGMQMLSLNDIWLDGIFSIRSKIKTWWWLSKIIFKISYSFVYVGNFIKMWYAWFKKILTNSRNIFCYAGTKMFHDRRGGSEPDPPLMLWPCHIQHFEIKATWYLLSLEPRDFFFINFTLYLLQCYLLHVCVSLTLVVASTDYIILYCLC